MLRPGIDAVHGGGVRAHINQINRVGLFCFLTANRHLVHKSSPMTARWTLLARVPSLARSSHCLSVTSTGRAILYAGELKPREPIDADNSAKGSLHIFDLVPSNAADSSKWFTVNADFSKASIPIPRVGAASAIIDDRLYVWGGRGGTQMAPLGVEAAGVYRCPVTDDALNGKLVWEKVPAVNESEAPDPRSYHAMVSHASKLYVHAGCPESGRLGDLYSFDVSTGKWATLAPAPGAGRGGTAIAVTKLGNSDVIVRFAGFAGYQLGSDNVLDVYNIAANTWSSTVPEADPSHGRPGPRSVHGLVGFQSAKFPNARAVLYHGESEASDLGHAGAGSFWSDVWFLEEKTGAETLHWKCIPVEGAGPAGRGWFPSAAWTDEGETRVILQGGLLSSNERSDELWSLEVV